jgi:hypothetical protein
MSSPPAAAAPFDQFLEQLDAGMAASHPDDDSTTNPDQPSWLRMPPPRRAGLCAFMANWNASMAGFPSLWCTTGTPTASYRCWSRRMPGTAGRRNRSRW